MKKTDIIIVGIGDSGSNVANQLNSEGYNTLAIHANYNLENKLSCPQINLLRNHWREDEYPGFTNDIKNIEMLLEENKKLIFSYIKILLHK